MSHNRLTYKSIKKNIFLRGYLMSTSYPKA